VDGQNVRRYPRSEGSLVMRHSSRLWINVAFLAIAVGQAAAQNSHLTGRLERLFFVEIASLLCEIELPDEIEHALDQAIRVEQRRLRLTDRQMAAVYEKVRATVAANREVACESVRQLDPSPDDTDE
jgi:hypothetical protein